MHLVEKINWFLINFMNGEFDHYTDQDWLKFESELVMMINNCNDSTLLQECISNDVNYIIPYDVRLALHAKLTELEPDNEKAIRDYAFYLDAFGDEPEEKKAADLLKRFENRK